MQLRTVPRRSGTYAALGVAIARLGVGAPGCIREHYLSEATTEVCWPVSLDVG